jgi:hypothetical protein
MFWSTVGVQRRAQVPACHIAPFPNSVKMAYSPSRVSRWRRRADSWGQSEMHYMTPAGGWPRARQLYEFVGWRDMNKGPDVLYQTLGGCK